VSDKYEVECKYCCLSVGPVTLFIHLHFYYRDKYLRLLIFEPFTNKSYKLIFVGEGRAATVYGQHGPTMKKNLRFLVFNININNVYLC
jgi:hypothetical protein